MSKSMTLLSAKELAAAKAETRRLSRLARLTGIHDVSILEQIIQIAREEGAA